MLTVTLILSLAILILTLGSAIGKVPLWIPVLIVAILLALEHLPLK